VQKPRPKPRFTDFVQGEWIERRYSDGNVKRYRYVGVFTPSEPFLAVYYDDEKDDLVTEPVYAFVARVVQFSGTHFVEILPVTAYLEGFLEAESEEGIANYVGAIPARCYEKVYGDLLKRGRDKWREKTSTEGDAPLPLRMFYAVMETMFDRFKKYGVKWLRGISVKRSPQETSENEEK
jgi:hypothetical protein